MSKIAFTELLTQENEKIKQIQLDMESKKTGLTYVKEIQKLYPLLNLTNGHELTVEMEKLKIPQVINQSLKSIEKKIDLVKSYNLDKATQTMIVNLHLDSKSVKVPAITLTEIISSKLKLKDSHPMYFTVMSYLMNEEVFEMMQLEKALEQV